MWRAISKLESSVRSAIARVDGLLPNLKAPQPQFTGSGRELMLNALGEDARSSDGVSCSLSDGIIDRKSLNLHKARGIDDSLISECRPSRLSKHTYTFSRLEMIFKILYIKYWLLYMLQRAVAQQLGLRSLSDMCTCNSIAWI